VLLVVACVPRCPSFSSACARLSRTSSDRVASARPACPQDLPRARSELQKALRQLTALLTTHAFHDCTHSMHMVFTAVWDSVALASPHVHVHPAFAVALEQRLYEMRAILHSTSMRCLAASLYVLVSQFYMEVRGGPERDVSARLSIPGCFLVNALHAQR
jgi:hypothetical protein